MLWGLYTTPGCLMQWSGSHDHNTDPTTPTTNAENVTDIIQHLMTQCVQNTDMKKKNMLSLCLSLYFSLTLSFCLALCSQCYFDKPTRSNIIHWEESNLHCVEDDDYFQSSIKLTGFAEAVCLTEMNVYKCTPLSASFVLLKSVYSAAVKRADKVTAVLWLK